MQDIKEFEVGGQTFRVAQLGGMRACKLVARMLRLFGPAFTKALGSSGTVGLEALANLNVGALSDAVLLLAQSLTEQETEDLIKVLLSTAQIKKDGQWLELMPKFDLYFAGRFYDVIKLCAHATEVHIGNFFAALRDDAKNWMPAKTLPSAGSTTSETGGQSGA